MPFRPKTQNYKLTKFDVTLAERTSRWAEKRKEKMKRKREEILKEEESRCSFKPRIVREIDNLRTKKIGIIQERMLRVYTHRDSCKKALKTILLDWNKQEK
jgi:aspartyl/asparaginyl beta-hydroxylase (cupin superfamily)